MEAGEHLARRLERADDRCTGMRLRRDQVQLLAAAARTCGLYDELVAYDQLEDPPPRAVMTIAHDPISSLELGTVRAEGQRPFLATPAGHDDVPVVRAAASCEAAHGYRIPPPPEVT